MTDPTEAIRKAHAAFAALPSATTLSALHLVCKPSALGALLDRLDSAERDQRRYRKWRDEYASQIVFNESPDAPINEMLLALADAWTGEDVDKVIDAAIDAALRVGAVGEQKER